MPARGTEFLFVGDGGAYELKGAKQVGMQSVLIRGTGTEIDASGLRPEAKTWSGLAIDSLCEVIEIVRRMDADEEFRLSP